MLPSQRSPARSLRSAEETGRIAGLVLGHRIFLDRAGLGIEPAEELLAEARIPGDAVIIDDHVVRRDRVARQVIFGVDHAGGAAARPRERHEVEAPLLLGAEIDGRPELGGGAIDLHALIAALLHPPLAAAQLRVLPMLWLT